jgi:hypothetical protein
MVDKQQEAPGAEKGGHSASLGMVCLLVLGGLFALHDSRTVAAVVASQEVASVAKERVAGFALASPEDSALVDVTKSMEAVAAGQGGADCSPLFELLAREGTRRGARSNVATALGILARLEVFRGDLSAAANAATRYEDETSDDTAPSEVDAWVWRIRELVDHPASRKLDRSQLRRALFAKVPIDEALKAAD